MSHTLLGGMHAEIILIAFGRMFFMKSLATRLAATILAVAFWFAFIVLYLTFFVGTFDIWEKLAIFTASVAIVVGIVAAMWSKWMLESTQKHAG